MTRGHEVTTLSTKYHPLFPPLTVAHSFHELVLPRAGLTMLGSVPGQMLTAGAKCSPGLAVGKWGQLRGGSDRAAVDLASAKTA
ncbi:hypothetical protein VTJ49DRAFT_1597 [Mycothermus thermophilus]|uniref:Uncharacterized protein n=1 Tax=Humicola insolens TaxID=85995 RepID=A0ABR3VCC8_HUMIN